MFKQTVELDCETYSSYTMNMQANSEQINNLSQIFTQKSNNDVTRLP